MDLHIIMQALFSTQSNEGSFLTPIARGSPSISLSGLNLRDLVRFVRERAGDFPSVSSNYQQDEEEGDDDDEEEENNSEGPDDYDSARHCFPPVKEAQKGEELLHSGDFGRVGIKIRSRANNCNLVKLVLNRASHPIPNLNKEDLLSVCFSFPYQNHELNKFLSTRTSFPIPMELQLQPMTPIYTLPSFQTAH